MLPIQPFRGNAKVPRAQPLDQSHEILKTAQAEARAKIQVGSIIERFGKIHRGEVVGDPQTLAVQIRAGEVLLRKALPDLSSIEMKADVDQSLVITVKKVA